MKNIIYIVIILLTILENFLNENIYQVTQTSVPFYHNFIFVLLFLIILLLLKERFFDKLIFSFLFYLITIIVIFYNQSLLLLFGIITFDITYKRNSYFWFIFFLFPIYIILSTQKFELFILLIFTCVIGYLLNDKKTTQEKYITIIDNERRLRYELEQTKARLIQNTREIERFTEIKERNRIAREIHDNIGHDIAGILFQLQAASKIYDKDFLKSKDIIDNCVKKLSMSLETLRITVHNIKPIQELNEKIFLDVIEHFVLCSVEFEMVGNFNYLTAEVIEILLSNLKESLTNAAKYSNATQIEIEIESQKNFVRYYYKDNGQGCENIKTGLGLSGMKERVKNVSGVFNVDGSNGFSIVCVIPNKKTTIFNG